MLRRRAILLAALATALVALPSPGPAAEVLSHVPTDALGFLLVRDLADTDGKVTELMQKFDVALPGPLAFLRLATGVEEGLDTEGDFLTAVVPGQDSADRPRFCVWLPVSDYEQLVDALHGDSADGITAVTVTGEDLLLAKQGAWALLMDPDQRDEMERLLGNPPGVPSQIADWSEWIDGNDATVVVLPPGLQLLSTRAATGESEARDRSDGAFQESDEEKEIVARQRRAAAGRRSQNRVAAVEDAARQAVQHSPQIIEWIEQSDAIAIGVRIDKSSGAALAGMRIAWKPDTAKVSPTFSDSQTGNRLPTFYRGGNFLLVGEARVPKGVMSTAAAAYTRLVAAGLADEQHVKLPPASVERLAASVSETAGRVESVAVLSRPGEPREGIYSTSVLAVRVDSADEFLAGFAGTMALWNEANEQAEGTTRLVFDRAVVPVAGAEAIEYSLDMIAAVGSPDLPEIRQTMEQLFGPEGKFRMLLIRIDDHTVLLTVEPPDRAASIVQEIAQRKVAAWEELEELKPTLELLPSAADWRVFISPHGYTNWLKRQMDVVLGPVIGRPIVTLFPESPPMGFAGGFSEGSTWIDVAVPEKTIDSAAAYLRELR